MVCKITMFSKMLKIDPTFPNEAKEAIIAAYEKGVSRGREMGERAGRHAAQAEIRDALGIATWEPNHD